MRNTMNIKVLKDFNEFLASKEFQECEDTTNALKLLAAYHKWLETELARNLGANILS